MAFFRNNTVNLLNVHYGLEALAAGGGIFYLVFLLKAGVAVPAVLATMGLVLVGRFAIRPLVVPLARRIGLKPLVMVGTVAMAVQYPVLAQVHGLDRWLLVLILVSAIGDTLYWTSYHAYFAAQGDAEHRGHQVGAREALASVVGIVAPLAAGWSLVTLGPRVAFGAVALVQTLAALPLLGTPDVKVVDRAPGAVRAAMRGFVLFAADGLISSGFFAVWQIALFVTLGRSFTAYGGAMALAALTGAVAGMLLGRHIDAGHGKRAVWLAFGVLAATLLLRAGAVTPLLAVIANAMGALVTCLYVPTLMTAVYNLSQDSPCPLRFQVVSEGGFDVGCGAGCLTTAALVALGAPLYVGMLISLVGAVGVLVLLRRYYGGLGSGPVTTAT